MKLTTFVLALVWSIVGVAQENAPLHVKKTNDFELDGKGNATEWQKTEFLPITKLRGDEINYTTKMKILYSDKGIYCLFLCEDNKITSAIREDFADIYNEDVVEAFFWTNEQSAIYFEYELSPYNYELPILVPNYNGTFKGWLPWHYEGEKKTRRLATIQNENGKVKGWTAEFFIPYALMEPLQNVPPKKGTQWRANFYRIDYDKGSSYWAWKPIRKNFHDYERFGTLIFD